MLKFFRSCIARFRQELNERAALWTSWPWRTTRAQRVGLLRMIAVAAEQHLPLVPLLEAWTSDERGVQHFRLVRVLRLLKDGVPLANAVEQVPGVLQDDDLLTIRFGSQSGTLAPALRSRISQIDSQAAIAGHSVRRSLIYGVFLVVYGGLIAAFIQVKIIPAFLKIFADFSIDVPAGLRVLQKLDHVFTTYWLIGAIALLFVAWSMFSPRPVRFVRNSILGRFFGPIRELRAADVMQKLGVAVQTGRPISGVLSTLARYHFDPSVRQKLLFVRNEVEQGADVWQSMSTVGLLNNPERRALAAAEQLGNQQWTLEQLAVTKRLRTLRRLARLADLQLPVMVIAIGILVLIQAVAIIEPLAKLIFSLT